MPALRDTKQVLSKYVVLLKGRKYLQVSGRIYSAHNARQLIGIKTELIENESHYIIIATATVLNDHLRNFEDLSEEAKIGTFTGMSQLPKKGGNMRAAEGTNPLETCETSAVGRALGFAGFGDLESIASAEEVEVAIARRTPSDDEELDEEPGEDYGYLERPAAPMEPIDISRRNLADLLESRGIKTAFAANEESIVRYQKKLSKLSVAEIDAWVEAETAHPEEPELVATPS